MLFRAIVSVQHLI